LISQSRGLGDVYKRQIYKREDAAILTYTEDDGETVEPEYYLPVLPMLLVNGCVGIGTGFSTDVPAYDPKQLVSLLRMRLDGSETTLAGRELDPWFQGFRGTMTRSNKTTWVTHGNYEFNDEENSITITELPVGKWSQTFKEDLDGMFAAPTGDAVPKRRGKGAADGGSVASGDKPTSVAERIGLESFVDDYNDRDVRFVLKFTADGYMNFKLDVPAFEKVFELTASHKTSNMVCFDAYGHISRYETVGDIMEEFYERRLEGYVDRKAAILEALEAELEELRARRKFVQLVLDEEMIIAKKEDEEIVDQMLAHDLPPLSEPLEPGSIKAYELSLIHI
jgi:DNA topoisomerase-2